MKTNVEYTKYTGEIESITVELAENINLIFTPSKETVDNGNGTASIVKFLKYEFKDNINSYLYEGNITEEDLSEFTQILKDLAIQIYNPPIKNNSSSGNC